MRNRILVLLLTAFCLQPSVLAEDSVYVVTSPDKTLKATVSLTDGKLSYNVARDSRTLVNESPLGLKISSANFSEGIELVEVDSSSVDDSYTLPVGKRSLV